MKKIEIIILIVFLLIVALVCTAYLGPVHWRHLFATKRSGTFYYTCTKCASTKHISKKYFFKYIPITTSDKILYKAPGILSCSHVWRAGVNTFNPNPILDGDVVLVRKNGTYGAFILQKQNIYPGKAEYEWWIQSDGSGNLDKSSKTVTTGVGLTPGIRFLDFHIGWHGNAKGSGKLEYKRFSGAKITKNDLYFCITKLKSLKGIDAADPKWKYKSSPK